MKLALEFKDQCGLGRSPQNLFNSAEFTSQFFISPGLAATGVHSRPRKAESGPKVNYELPKFSPGGFDQMSGVAFVDGFEKAVSFRLNLSQGKIRFLAGGVSRSLSFHFHEDNTVAGRHVYHSIRQAFLNQAEEIPLHVEPKRGAYGNPNDLSADWTVEPERLPSLVEAITNVMGIEWGRHLSYVTERYRDLWLSLTERAKSFLLANGKSLTDKLVILVYVFQNDRGSYTDNGFFVDDFAEKTNIARGEIATLIESNGDIFMKTNEYGLLRLKRQ
jgi:hypothetical protein